MAPVTPLVTASILIFLIGCRAESDQIASPQVLPAKPDTAQVEADLPIDRSVVSRLFQTGWTSDDAETIKFEGNSEWTEKDIGRNSWLFTIQLKYTGFFKDEGFKLTTARGESIMIPATYDPISENLKIIDNNRFALRNDIGGKPFWIIFLADAKE